MRYHGIYCCLVYGWGDRRTKSFPAPTATVVDAELQARRNAHEVQGRGPTKSGAISSADSVAANTATILIELMPRQHSKARSEPLSLARAP